MIFKQWFTFLSALFHYSRKMFLLLALIGEKIKKIELKFQKKIDWFRVSSQKTSLLMESRSIYTRDHSSPLSHSAAFSDANFYFVFDMQL